MKECRVCGRVADHRSLLAREMMFGFRTEFGYFECGDCGCVQIEHIPEDIATYYPEHYLALRTPEEPVPAAPVRWLKHQWALHHLGRPNPVGWILTRRYGTLGFFEWTRRAGVGFGDAILDVGSGAGADLLTMRTLGFSDLTGMDPFVPADIRYANGVRIRKLHLSQMDGQYDFVMLNHSFEHMPDPLSTLRQVHRLLRPSRYALIRIPVADSHAWQTYGADWVQLDAPRHFFLHTRRSMQQLADAAGFEVADVVYDSTAFQFWGSEQYRRDIPLTDPRSAFTTPPGSLFSAGQLRQWEQEASALNRTRRGDQACFYLRRRA